MNFKIKVLRKLRFANDPLFKKKKTKVKFYENEGLKIKVFEKIKVWI